MAKKDFNEEDGVWRTIGGRKVFIRKGQSVSDAMKESGKFKKKNDDNDTPPPSTSAVKKDDDKSNWTKEDYIKRNQDLEEAKKRVNEDYERKFTEARRLGKGEEVEKETRRDQLAEIERLQKENRDEYDNYRKNKKESSKDPYDDPESEESQRLQSIQSRYDDYLQKTEGRGASYGEIAYVDGLRGKDLDDFEKELDDFDEEEYNKRFKNTGGAYVMPHQIEAKQNKSTNDYKVTNGNPIEDLISKEGINVGGRLRQVDDEARELFKSINDKNLSDEQAKFMLHSKYYDSNEDNLLDKYKEWQKQNQSTNDDEIVNDDEKSLKYTFRVGDRNLFEVRYDRTGNNKNMDFATSSSELNKRRSDITRGGQAQKDLLKEGTKARKFYDKWDKKHLGTLTQKEYNELVNDIEELKQQYPHIESDRFSDQVELDRNSKASKPKTTNETMNNAIREKASKRKISYQKSYSKDGSVITQNVKISSDEKSNINNAIKKEIEAGYPNYEKYANDKNSARMYLEELGDDNYKDTNITTNRFIKNFLDDDKIKTDRNTRYSINDAIRSQANVKNAYKQYLKDHPNSKMSLNEFKKMNK